MRRWIPFLLFGLALVGVAVLLSSFADDQAELIVDAAPAQSEEVEVDRAQLRACERARLRYDEVWDESLENPGDESYEEKLEIAMGDVLENCDGQ